MMKITIQREDHIISIEKTSESLDELMGAYLSSLFVLGYSEDEIENHIRTAYELIKNNQEKDEPKNKNVMPLGL
jgi:hypothetical protein